MNRPLPPPPCRLGLVAAACMLSAALGGRASAQPFDIPWRTVDGGGAMFSSAGQFGLGGTIGQPDAQGPVMTGGQFAVVGGFWPVSAPPCRADFNADGVVNSQDFFDFLTAFFASAPAADFNGDALINSQDFFDFLTAFFAGCP